MMSNRHRKTGQKKGDRPSHPRTIPLKMGMKKGKGVPTALEAPLPVIFYPSDFIDWLATFKAYPAFGKIASHA